MDNFTIIYRILKLLEASMDSEAFPRDQFKAETFKTSETRFEALVRQLIRDGYIEGVSLVPALGRDLPGLKIMRPEITIKGLEYLSENSMMKKAANVAKGLIDLVT